MIAAKKRVEVFYMKIVKENYKVLTIVHNNFLIVLYK